ncbi:nicotinate-nucleotide adenylyltransferase [Coralliovum pocilloporae]|uniref:nicotinate-nucleotide adenylyltransferase n=1 Tax=Coralliovum pocilloporae TaxID=3066369 RepID=UPI003306C985
MSNPYQIPPAHDGMTIGLYGGTFDPPHDGHRHVAETALRRLALDSLWWMVTPGNPLKTLDGLCPLTERIRSARHLAGQNPKLIVTALEAGFTSRFTAETIATLIKKCPRARFVWVMGADNLATFHKWQDWQSIARQVPIAIIDRPGSTFSALSSRTAQALRAYRKAETSAARLAAQQTPAWTFLHDRKIPISSTDIRDLRGGRNTS